ncbi:MAG: ABC transporter permease [Clostridiales bacterium]|nr:ABC transporter permease [Clostridiales bacterium]MDD6054285.1 ABC transporter permease [Clostridiales bacterium]
MKEIKSNKAPLFHVSKRNDQTLKSAILVRTVAIVAGILFCALICAIIFKTNPFRIIFELFNGNFGTERRIWMLLRDTALLLGVGLALLPAFKMKFWNLGGNGQILMGCLATVACMFYFGGKLPDGVVILMMVVASILAGAIWAVIPAIFKAFFKTNESLFTLMMNYIAAGLVAYCLNGWVKTGSGVLNPLSDANLPEIVNPYLLIILVVAVLTVFMYFYNKHSKHGFEVAVVGENENTAKYVGINVKKVVIRTLILSGAICGIIGLLIGGAMDHTINTESAKNLGFTAIMVTWLAKFNPFMMVLSAFFIVFVTRGMGQVQTACGITNNAVSNVVVGIIYFFIIGCEFFIAYKVTTRSGKTIGQLIKEVWLSFIALFKKKEVKKEELVQNDGETVTETDKNENGEVEQ